MVTLGIFSAWNNTFTLEGLAVHPELCSALEGKMSENLPSFPQINPFLKQHKSEIWMSYVFLTELSMYV